MPNEAIRPTGLLRGRYILGLGPLDWGVSIGFIIFHLMVIPAMFYVTWGAVVAAVILWVIGGLGVTMGYHRLLTHKSFQTYKLVRWAITITGVLAFQGSPIKWVIRHLMHHRRPDTNEDPHSPIHGLPWAHILGFCFKEPEDRDTFGYASGLKKERFMVFFEKFFWLPQAVMTGILGYWGYTVGGTYGALAWIFWGMGVRTVFTWHATWLVNSAGHTWGYRSFPTNDFSTNNWWVALLSFGEGWHNNHHAFMASARHGLLWFEFDPTWYTIYLMERFHLAWNVNLPQLPYRAPSPHVE